MKRKMCYIIAILFVISGIIFYMIGTINLMDFWLKFWIFMGILTPGFIFATYIPDKFKKGGVINSPPSETENGEG